MGLAAVVGTIPTIKLNSVMKLITDLLDVSSSMKGQVHFKAFLRRYISFMFSTAILIFFFCIGALGS